MFGLSPDALAGTRDDTPASIIGTDATGAEDQGNGNDGVQSIDGKDNAIGGTSPEARNLISGNGGDGVNIGFESASSNKIVDNLIGTNKDGTSALGNDENGVLINGSPNTTVGGALPGATSTVSL